MNVHLLRKNVLKNYFFLVYLDKCVFAPDSVHIMVGRI